MIDFKGIWYEHLPSVQFFYNNSFHSIISMAPFEAFYGRRCRYPVEWLEVGESSLLGPELIYDALLKVSVIRNRLKEAYSKQNFMPIIGEETLNLK